MTIDRISYTRYELPFAKPVHTAQGVLTVRKGFIVTVHTDQGIGIGEVAPLAEFGTETLEAAEAAVEDLPAKTPSSRDEITIGANLPATRFGVESALKGIEEQRADRRERKRIPVNALIAGETIDGILERARAAVDNGYETLKVKVGTRPVRNDIELLRMLRSRFRTIVLRADANGAWTLDEARQFAHGVTASNLDYIEDPLREPSLDDLAVFRQNCTVAVACDDMVRGIGGKRSVLEHKLCDVIILKPSVVGSYTALEDLAASAKQHGISVVISSLLESSVGLSYVAWCAAQYGTAGIAQGVGTAGLLAKDLLRTPLSARHGMITVPDLSTLTVDMADFPDSSPLRQRP